MVEFAGWLMPVQYSGVINELNAVHSRAGIFDVSHMGEIEIKGTGANRFVNRITTNDVSNATEGRIVYSLMLNETGGIIDDLLVYCLSPENFLLVVNASNIEKDFQWISAQVKGEDVQAVNRSDDFALLAVQGPNALAILAEICEIPATLPYYHFTHIPLSGAEAMISRTGYTGEDGFEIYLPPEKAGDVWNLLMEKGKTRGLEPCGLGARDVLRIEAGYPLYGHELNEQTDPITAGLKWAVKKTDVDFIGKSRLPAGTPDRKRIGFTIEGRGIPREGYALLAGGKKIGEVTSGTFSPSLQKGIGMGYIAKTDGRFLSPGDRLDVEIRGKQVPAKVCRLPFVKHRTYKNR